MRPLLTEATRAVMRARHCMGVMAMIATSEAVARGTHYAPPLPRPLFWAFAVGLSCWFIYEVFTRPRRVVGVCITMLLGLASAYACLVYLDAYLGTFLASALGVAVCLGLIHVGGKLSAPDKE